MRETIIEDWIQYHTGHHKGDDPLSSAWKEVQDIVNRDPEVAWPVVLRLIAAAPTDPVLANVAAGPLEDLITRWPDLMIGRVEAQARRDPKFRRCLTGVWGIPTSIRGRIIKYTSTVMDHL